MTIRDLAEAIARAAEWSGEFCFDHTKSDGMPRKIMDGSRMAALGWKAETNFEEGIRAAYDWYLRNRADLPRSSETPLPYVVGAGEGSFAAGGANKRLARQVVVGTLASSLRRLYFTSRTRGSSYCPPLCLLFLT